MKRTEANIQSIISNTVEQAKECKKDIPHMQTAVYVMCGGGMIGKSAAEQPAGFYIDDRVGKLPYARRDILRAVRILAAVAEACGFDTRRGGMPKDYLQHNLGIF